MRALVSIVLAVLLVGCGNIKFTEPQPANVRAEQKFPEELQGIYVGKEKDTIEINSEEIIWRVSSKTSGKQREIFSLENKPDAHKIVLKK